MSARTAAESIERTTPIFIGGEHRSGTTLLAAILDSHSQVTFGLELDFLEPVDLGPHLLECLALLRAGQWASLERGTALARFHWGVQFVRQCASFGVAPEVLEALIRDLMEERRSVLCDPGDRCALVNAIGEWQARQLGVECWGFKIQRHIVGARSLGRFWPRARFIHIVRDGRDIAASHVRDHSDWGYRDVCSAALGWSSLVKETRSLLKWPAFHEIRYEDLIRDPEATLCRLTRFLELPWEKTLLQHSQVAHAFLKPGGYDHPSTAAIQKPIHDRAVSRHRLDLSPAERAALERISAPWLAALGYEIDP